MGSNKLFEAHERARVTAEAAAKKYAEFLKDASKADEKDSEGNRSAQTTRVKRALKSK